MNMKGVRQLTKLANGPKSKTHEPMSVDVAAIRELAELLTETGLTEIEIEQGGQRLRVSRQASPLVHTVPGPAAGAQAEPATSAPEPAPNRREGHAPGTITSPMVGTVYVAPQPGAPPFVKVGDAVKEGDTLLIVEAMKTMNPILAPRSGTVSEICVRDAEPVEFGQALLILS